MKATLDKLKEKLIESLQAVLPIVCIVMVLCFSVAPISPSILLCFLMGAAMIVLGLMFFTLGAETSMSPMGEKVGAAMTRTKKLWVIVPVSFILGFIITISEPDLQVLAHQVPAIPNNVIVFSVAVGVGIFLVVALLRMLFGIPLNYLLVGCYILVFGLTPFVPESFWAIAFDSGGVASGPMTSGFILPFAIGVCVTLQGESAVLRDGFGVVTLVAMAPLITIQLLGFKAIVTNRIKEKRAMQRILRSDDEQIINFM